MLIGPILDTYARAQIDRHLSKNKTQRKKFIGASEIGLCARRIWYAKQQQNAPIDTKHSDIAESWGASRRGVIFESKFWLPAMRARFGDNLLYAGPKQISMTFGPLRATPDGLLVHQPRTLLKDFGITDIGSSREVVTECKTVDPRIPLQTAKAEHVFQTIVQLEMFHRTTKHRPKYAVVSYANASFYDDVTEFIVARDPAVFEHAIRRADKILQTTDVKLTKPEGWVGGGRECGYCKFKTSCDIVRIGEPAVVPAPSPNPKAVEELYRLGKAERALATRTSRLEEEQRDLQDQIKRLLSDIGLRTVDDPRIKIIWSPVVGRPAWDMPALRNAAQALGLDIQKFERTGAPSDRLLVTLKQRKDSAASGELQGVHLVSATGTER